MSKDIKMGVRSRKIMTIMLAAFAVALMIAVPLFAAVDTDATITANKKGYLVKMENPTAAQLSDFGEMEKDDIFYYSVEECFGIFNEDVFYSPSVGDVSYNFAEGWGQEVTSDSKTDLNLEELSAETVTMTTEAYAAGKLISPYVADAPADVKAAANAIAAFIGENVGIGDKVTVTGTVKQKEVLEIRESYILLDDNKCVIKSSTQTTYLVKDIKLTITFKSGSNAEKSIEFVDNIKGLIASDWTYEYSADPITAGTAFTKKNTVTNVYSGGVCFKVDGKDYNISVDAKKQADEPGTAVLIDQSTITVSPELVNRMANFPSAVPANVNLDLTYDGINTECANVIMEAVGDDILKVLLVAGGVILAIIILVIILIIILIVRKKR